MFQRSSMQLGARQTMTATGANTQYAVAPQLFSVEEIKPNLIPAGEKRRVAMRLTMSSVFAGSDKWLPSFALNNGIRVQLTLDQAANVVKVNDAAGNPLNQIHLRSKQRFCFGMQSH